MKTHSKLSLIPLAILLLVVAMACQSAAAPAVPTATPAKKLDTPTPAVSPATKSEAPAAKDDAQKPAAGGEHAAAIQTLYEKAKAEGEVVIWGRTDVELEWIPDAFAKRFPGIKVTWVTDLDAATNIIAQSRAGRHTVDVFTWSLGGTLPLQERGLLAKNDWTIWGVPPSNVMINGNSATTHNLVNIIMYNTKLVKPAELPTSWDDLLDPKYQGQIAASDFGVSGAVAFLALKWGEPKALQYARDLRDKAKIMISKAPLDTIVEAGERAYGLGTYLDSVEAYKDKGRPFDWAAFSPTGTVQFVVSPLDKSPHPNAAKLLAGWLASDEAKVIKEQFKHSADVRPGATSKMAKTLKERNVELIYEDVDNLKVRADLYDKLMPIFTGQVR